jgi:aldehyde dehydrogenase (NAD+)
MEAAARHLTPVTLELGGKSPAIVEQGANVEVAARRVVWGRFLNAGQTCVSPDYVLVDRQVEEQFIAAAARAVEDFYGPHPQSSPDYARIVSERHWDRLDGLLASVRPGQVVTGGGGDRGARFLAPTVLRDVGWDDPVMGEEIFGPILPVLPVDGVDEAIRAVTSHDKPLALYVFTEDQSVVDRVVAETSSGGVGVNVSLLQFVVQALPFGGVGASGMGSYHGQAGFDTFSHRKAVFQRPTRPDPPLTYPPFTRLKQRVLRKVF